MKPEMMDPSLAHFAGLGPGTSLLEFLPFALLLGCIALFPLMRATEAWWGKNLNKAMVALSCSLAGCLLYALPTGDISKLVHTFLEYLTFISLLASLYVVCGGIHVTGAFSGLPYMNTMFLACGALLANLMGTTGASMILIRPFLRANRLRRHNAHVVVFFIFIVSNGGGLLTPLGDPPLYLGFLRGVPFTWNFRLLPQWAVLIVGLLFVFHFIDEIIFHREEKDTKHSLVLEITRAEKKIYVEGWRNLFFLLALLAVILASGYLVYPRFSAAYGDEVAGLCSEVFQIIAFGLVALMSYDLTSPRMFRRHQYTPSIYQKNEFSMGAIVEVAILFLGIFGAMIPALAILEAKSANLAVNQPWHYFWGSGILSSFLDNAPTYLTFATLAAGKSGLAGGHLARLAAEFPRLLEAVACGSVFMGANTYIGNGPNFMVKTIAEQARVKMPSFFAYMGWSLCVLVPLFAAMTWIFFR